MIGTGSRQGAMSCGVHPAASHARRGMIGAGPGPGGDTVKYQDPITGPLPDSAVPRLPRRAVR